MKMAVDKARSFLTFGTGWIWRPRRFWLRTDWRWGLMKDATYTSYGPITEKRILTSLVLWVRTSDSCEGSAAQLIG